MTEFIQFLLWEWINIALEYTAVAWTRLPHLGWSVIGVNVATHPVFAYLWPRFGGDMSSLLLCEGVIFLVEWALFVLFYGRARWLLLGFAALLMNAASCGTGLLIDL